MVQPSSGAAQPPRQQFLTGLLKADLAQVGTWHNTRTWQDQQRFLKSASFLQKAHSAQNLQSHISDVTLAITNSSSGCPPQTCTPQCGSEPSAPSSLRRPASLSRSCGATRSSRLSRSGSRCRTSALAARTRKKPNKQEDAFQTWLENEASTSCSSHTTASSRKTTFSKATKTDSEASVCSEPFTGYQKDYRQHRRAFAVNKNHCPVVNQHLDGALKDGVPTQGFPREECLQTAYEDAFGDRPCDGQQEVFSGLYEGVIKGDKQAFVGEVLQTASVKERKQVLGMVRSLESLRRQQVQKSRSVGQFDYDLTENTKFFKATQGTKSTQRGPTSGAQPLTVSKNMREEVRPLSPGVSELGSIDLACIGRTETRDSTPSASTGTLRPALSSDGAASATALAARKTRPLSAPVAGRKVLQTPAHGHGSSSAGSCSENTAPPRPPRPASAVYTSGRVEQRPLSALSASSASSLQRRLARPASAAAAVGVRLHVENAVLDASKQRASRPASASSICRCTGSKDAEETGGCPKTSEQPAATRSAPSEATSIRTRVVQVGQMAWIQ
eukprot:TRINITY_DN16570_c0_g1_i1.p1 TRINITY_DN16570_c0_g1~~TRINITY_DN16570_c0_g1_i1.p1  ORF type:complete len:558 (-),score=66.83 TRINITY_DN16570_c0_g1_i1:59-1732(-)